MFKKLKSIGYSILSVSLLAPALAMAEDTGTGGFGGVGSFSPTNAGLPTGSISSIIVAILNFLLMAVGLIGIIGFLIAGILYLTAAGDDKRIEQAKKAMTYSIIGVIVALAGYVALQAAQSLLNANSSF